MRNFIIVAQLALLIWFGSVIVPLENYRYANSVGMCAKHGDYYGSELIAQERCLLETETRTSPIWHLAYALDLL